MYLFNVRWVSIHADHVLCPGVNGKNSCFAQSSADEVPKLNALLPLYIDPHNHTFHTV